MDKIDELLRYIHRTNPEMTREKLINELSRSDYAARSLLFHKRSCLSRRKIVKCFWGDSIVQWMSYIF